jgi:sarcosine oxidase
VSLLQPEVAQRAAPIPSAGVSNTLVPALTYSKVFAEHYDEGRITRQTSPDRVWARVGRESLLRYGDVQEESGVEFYQEVGCLTLAPSSHPAIEACMAAAPPGDTALLDSEALRETFPYLELGGEGQRGVYEARKGGYISPRGQLLAHQTTARRRGATIVHDVVVGIQESPEDGDDGMLMVVTTANHGETLGHTSDRPLHGLIDPSLAWPLTKS